jgi:indolepyruvate ferredoxin oxidoreductase alpha subunit
MGASVNMAKGASDAGIEYAIGVIGDSTFLHSGITPLIDAVKANTPMTLVILDNSIVAMTGCQDTMLPSAAIVPLLQGLGVDPEHIVVLEALKKNFDANLAAFRKELEYRGLSVVVFRRECLEAFKARQKKEAAKARGAASCEG